jgi:hypothetical protein
MNVPAAPIIREALANRPQETRTMHDPHHWTVALFGGTPASVRYRLDEEPEDRELEALLEKHAATEATVYPPAADAAIATAPNLAAAIDGLEAALDAGVPIGDLLVAQSERLR